MNRATQKEEKKLQPIIKINFVSVSIGQIIYLKKSKEKEREREIVSVLLF